MFTEQNVIDYYNINEVQYKMSWKLDTCLAMHYGYADKDNKSFEKSLLRMNTFLIEQANITKDDYVLDAGCGVGGSSIFMSKHTGCKATGITLAPRQVESATKSAKTFNVDDRVNFDTQNYLHTSFADETFDVVWALESSCHAPDKADFYNEAYRILKPGGRLIVCDYVKQTNVSEEGQKLLDNWLHGWMIKDIPNLADINGYLSKFSESFVEDISEYIMPSAKYMNRMYYIGYLYHRIYDLFFKVAKESEGNFLSAKYQYQSLKKEYWSYNLITAVK